MHGGLPDNEKSWRICHLVSIQHTNVRDKTDRRVDSAQRTTSPAPSTALLSTNDIELGLLPIGISRNELYNRN